MGATANDACRMTTLESLTKRTPRTIAAFVIQSCVRRRRPMFLLPLLAGFVMLLSARCIHAADEPPSAVAPVMRLLQSGRLPPERLENALQIVCSRGNEHDLAYVYGQCLAEGGYTGRLRVKVLGFLAEAAEVRKVKPAGELAGIAALLKVEDDPQNRGLKLAAMRLVGLWKVTAAADEMRQLALDLQAEFRVRRAAVQALSHLGGEVARRTIDELTASLHPQPLRYEAVAALTNFSLCDAAAAAARVLADAGGQDDPAVLLAAFFDRRGGADQLAAALAKQSIPADIAKLALRYMYSVGRSDQALSDALSAAAGVETEAVQLSDAELHKLIGEVLQTGDPHRGEEIFRRSDLSCLKCHAVSKAGGNVGPELSAVGGSSPVDYLVRSILNPNQDIKEQYKTTVLVTADGRVFTGIIVDRDEDRVVLKEADSKLRTIPTADIDEEAEGASLMPKGLTKFLTRGELVDLVRFLSELGKPGAFAIPTVPHIQRWRLLVRPPDALLAAVPDDETFRQLVLDAGSGLQWLPAYGKVAGALPLSELTTLAAGPVLYVQGEIDVAVAGDLTFQLNAAEGAQAWLDGEGVGSQREFTATLQRGRHTVTFRVDLSQRKSPELSVAVVKPAGSAAEYEIVGGP